MSEVKFEPFQRVLVRETDDMVWKAAIFSHQDDEGIFCASCEYWEQCLPYNNETKHLLGTTDDHTPPKPEFKWGEKVEAKDEMQEPYEPAIYLSPITDHPILKHRVIYKGQVTPCCVERCRHADW